MILDTLLYCCPANSESWLSKKNLCTAAEALATPFHLECDNFNTGHCHLHFIFSDFYRCPMSVIWHFKSHQVFKWTWWRSDSYHKSFLIDFSTCLNGSLILVYHFSIFQHHGSNPHFAYVQERKVLFVVPITTDLLISLEICKNCMNLWCMNTQNITANLIRILVGISCWNRNSQLQIW